MGDEAGRARPRAREMTGRECAALVAMIERGVDDEGRTTRVDRDRWQAGVPDVRVGGRFGCGTCPSIHLTDARGRVRPAHVSRVVLQAGTVDGLLLLFVDDDRPSYLELAPWGSDEVPGFPPPEEIDVG